MRDALDDQIDAYEALLPQIKKEHGSGWVVVAGKRPVRVFRDFAAAAGFARDNLSDQQVLIRHTDEAALTAPFVHIEG
jgi:hypothetical protein